MGRMDEPEERICLKNRVPFRPEGDFIAKDRVPRPASSDSPRRIAFRLGLRAFVSVAI